MKFKDFEAPVLFSSTFKNFQGCMGTLFKLTAFINTKAGQYVYVSMVYRMNRLAMVSDTVSLAIPWVCHSYERADMKAKTSCLM